MHAPLLPKGCVWCWGSRMAAEWSPPRISMNIQEILTGVYEPYGIWLSVAATNSRPTMTVQCQACSHIWPPHLKAGWGHYRKLRSFRHPSIYLSINENYHTQKPLANQGFIDWLHYMICCKNKSKFKFSLLKSCLIIWSRKVIFGLSISPSLITDHNFDS